MIQNDALPFASRPLAGPMLDQIAARLSRTPPFAPLPPATLARLLDGAHEIDVAADAVLFAENTPADRFYVVLEGQVVLFATLGGRESVVEVAGPGDSVAEAAIFDSGDFPVSARTLMASRLVMVPAAPLLERLAAEFDLVRAMLGGLSGRLRMLVRQIGELKLKSTSQRLGGFLLGLTDAESGPATVRLPYEKKLLANHLGMKPESLSRALTRLREVGVQGDGDRFHIQDVAALSAYCREAGL